MSRVAANPRRRGPVRRAVRRYLSRPTNAVALAVLALVLLSALLADLLASEKPLACRLDGELHVLPTYFSPPELADHDNHSVLEAVRRRGGWAVLPPIPYGPDQIEVCKRIDLLAAPGAVHPLGTDDAGRDVAARLLHGSRAALLVGVGSMTLAVLLGVLLGSLGAYFGGKLDRLVLTLVETLSAFPSLFLILALQAVLGGDSLLQLVWILAATRWTDPARVTRAEVLRIVNEDYVDAARALGLSHARILRRHVLPRATGPVLVSAAFGVGGAIIIESVLSFLGFGAPPPTASWGQLLTDALANEGCYWLMLFPGLALFATVLSINLVGAGLREAIDVPD